MDFDETIRAMRLQLKLCKDEYMDLKFKYDKFAKGVERDIKNIFSQQVEFMDVRKDVMELTQKLRERTQELWDFKNYARAHYVTDAAYNGLREDVMQKTDLEQYRFLLTEAKSNTERLKTMEEKTALLTSSVQANHKAIAETTARLAESNEQADDKLETLRYRQEQALEKLRTVLDEDKFRNDARFLRHE